MSSQRGRRAKRLHSVCPNKRRKIGVEAEGKKEGIRTAMIFQLQSSDTDDEYVN